MPSNAHLTEDDSAKAREVMLQKIFQDSDLLSIGSTVARVVQIASEDDEAVHDLAYLILSDVALTQKILRLANTVYYRAASNVRVTTISRAIFVLGFNTVKTSALAMLLVDGLASKEHARSVRAELLQSVCASVLGRELARISHQQAAEEAAIAALFKNLGRVLVASRDHATYGNIMAQAGKELRAGGIAAAAQRVMGCSFESLALAVLQKWGIPDTIARATLAVPDGELEPPQSRQDWMQLVAAFSAEAGLLLPKEAEAGIQDGIQALHDRFGKALNLSQGKIQSLLTAAAPEVRTLAEAASLVGEAFPPEAAASPKPKVAGLPAELLLAAPGEVSQATDMRHPDGKPLNARDRLMSGIQDVTQMIASGRCKVNELMLLVLETLYFSLGFRFATLCLRDPRTGQFRARVALGERQAERQAGFVVANEEGNDLFSMSLSNDVDLMISDASAANIVELLPRWHKSLLPDARSFIVLSLVVNKSPIGFYYADRIHVMPDGLPADETALIKILKNQVLSMLQK